MKNNQLTVGLIANPNTGKTSLLNSLTGMSLHVGNWSGKTVEEKEGVVNFRDTKIRLVDLPGTYSLVPYSDEEKIVRNFLTQEDADIIVQIIDVNSLERNLLLTFELLALGKKLILAFNFNKEARSKGLIINVKKLEEKLGLPIVEIEANTGENKETLLKKVINVAADDLKEPSYLGTIMKDNKSISHRAVLDFIKNKILPFYHSPKTDRVTEKIDFWFLNKYTSLPLFFLVIYLMFKITFALSLPLTSGIGYLFALLSKFVLSMGLPNFLSSFFVEAIIGGVGLVLSFAPLIFILFLLIGLLEDSGYFARTVIMLDRIFQKFGISGQTFLPMILGFGCNVPAIMATRTIQNKKERLIAIFINSFMSCSGRLPVYVLFTGIFFPKNAGLVIMLLYLGGVFIGLMASLILSRLIKDNGEDTLIIELPPYRFPTIKNVFKHAWWQMSMFFKKAGTLILGAVVVIWFLASLPWGVDYGSVQSYLGQLGQLITPILKPLGFGHWSFAVALIFGLAGKEVIIGTLGTLNGVSAAGLSGVLLGLITPLGAFSFLVFVLLYSPCLATVAMMKKESGSWKLTIIQVVAVTAIAWLVAFFVFRLGLILGLD